MTGKPKQTRAVLGAAKALLCGFFLSPIGLMPSGYAQTAPLTGLAPDHVTISVQDLDRVSAWYVRVLGFKAGAVSTSNPDFLNLHLTIPGYRIDLIKFKGSTRPAAVNPLYLHQGWIHIAFNLSDLTAAWKDLQALNTDVTQGGKDANGQPTRLVLHDPEGNEIELFARK